MMHLKNFKATNFRLLENFELNLSPDVTLLIGPNNAGKSNVVDALLLLSQCIVHHLWEKLNERYGFDRVVSRHQVDSTVKLELTFSHSDSRLASYSLAFGKDGLVEENVKIAGQEYRSWGEGNNVCYSYIGNKSDRRNLTLLLTWNSAPYMEEVRKFFLDVVHVNPFRQIEHQFNIEARPMVESRGVDLARVLHYHYNNDRRRFDAYEEIVRKVVPEIEMIETPILGGPSTTVSLTFAGDSQKYNLWQISSGLKDVLVLLAAVHFSHPSSLIMLEEPENHLHPVAQKALCSVIKEIANKEKKQFILTTHSEVILGQFEREKAVFIDKDNSRSRAVPLGEADLYQVWQRLGMERTVLLQLLARAAQALVIVEGKGDLIALEPVWEHFNLKDKVIATRSDGGGWKEIVDSAKSLRESLKRFRLPTNVFVLLDNDGERDKKVEYLRIQGFDEHTSHVWKEKEIESYLVLPSALTSISGKRREEVDQFIGRSSGRGKERLDRILVDLGISRTPHNVIVANTLRNAPGEMHGEVLEIPQKVERMLGLRQKQQV